MPKTKTPKPAAQKPATRKPGRPKKEAGDQVPAPAPPPPSEPSASAVAPLAAGMEISVSLDQLVPCPDNLRTLILEDETRSLSESIATLGLIDRLVVRPAGRAANKYQVVDGHRRRAAIELLPRGHSLKKAIPCVLREITDDQATAVMMTTQTQKKRLRTSELITGYQRLSEGRTAEQVAALTGETPGHVRTMLRRGRLPAIALEAIDSGKLPPATADLIAAIAGERSRERLAAQVLCGVRHLGPNEKTPKPEPDDEPLSYRAVKDVIAAQYQRQLKDAPFVRTRLYVIPSHPTPTCDECPQRAGNNAEATADGIRADVCLDVECYQRKVIAHGECVMSEAKQNGQTILSPQKCKPLFWGSGHLHSDCGYVDLDSTPGYGNSKTYRQLAKGFDLLDVVVAVNPVTQVPHQLLPVEKYNKLAKTNGKSSSGNGKVDEKAKKEEAERREENRIRKAIHQAVLAETHAAAVKLFAPLEQHFEATTVLRAITGHVMGGIWGSVVEDMTARRGVKGPMHQLRKTLADQIPLLNGVHCLATITEALMGRWANEGWNCDPVTLTALQRALGIDVDLIGETVTKKLKEQRDLPKLSAAPLDFSDTPRLSAAIPQLDSTVTLALAAAGIRTVGTLAERIRASTGQQPITYADVEGFLRSLKGLPIGNVGDAASRIDSYFDKNPPRPPAPTLPATTSPPPSVSSSQSPPSASQLQLTSIPGWPLGTLGPLADALVHTLVDLQVLVSIQDPKLDHEGKIYAALRSVPGVDPLVARKATDALLDYLYPGRPRVGDPVTAIANKQAIIHECDESGEMTARIVPADPTAHPRYPKWRSLPIDDLKPKPRIRAAIPADVTTIGQVADHLAAGECFGLSNEDLDQLTNDVCMASSGGEHEIDFGYDGPRCRVCQCTEDNCSGCVELTGETCTWTEPDLCSACARTPAIGAEAPTTEPVCRKPKAAAKTATGKRNRKAVSA